MKLRYILLMCVFSSLCADTVHFKDDLSLECDVVRVSDSSVQVRISKGTFSFSRDRIALIEYDFAKRKEMIPEGDFKAHYELGLWAYSCEQFDNALSQFLFCEGKESVPDDVLLYIAEIHLKKNDRTSAADYLKKYLEKHPTDEKTGAKLSRLVSEQTADTGAPGPSTVKSADEGFEALTGWLIEKWGNPGTVTVSKSVQDNTENMMLKIDYTAKGSSDKVAVRIQTRLDLTGKKRFILDVYNPDNRITSMAVAFVTSPGYAWYESKTTVIKPGWNLGVSFDLTSSDYKSQETNWAFTTPIKNSQDTSQFILLIYNGTREGSLFCDGIRVTED